MCRVLVELYPSQQHTYLPTRNVSEVSFCSIFIWISGCWSTWSTLQNRTNELPGMGRNSDDWDSSHENTFFPTHTDSSHPCQKHGHWLRTWGGFTLKKKKLESTQVKTCFVTLFCVCVHLLAFYCPLPTTSRAWLTFQEDLNLSQDDLKNISGGVAMATIMTRGQLKKGVETWDSTWDEEVSPVHPCELPTLYKQS